MTVLITFNKEDKIDILRDIISQNTLKPNEVKLKKPALVSTKHWEIILKLSGYEGNLKNLLENIPHFQK